MANRCRIHGFVCCVALLVTWGNQAAVQSEPDHRSHETDTANQESRGTVAAAELFRRATELIEKRQYLQAITLLRKEQASGPVQGWVHHYLGIALWKQGRLGSAVVEFKKALALERRNPSSEYFLAR